MGAEAVCQTIFDLYNKAQAHSAYTVSYLFAGSPFDPVEYEDKTIEIGQVCHSHISCSGNT